MPESIEYILVGLVVGTYGTMVGVGGGFLIVPYLLLFKHLTHDQAAGTSIAVVFLNALSGTIAYVKQKRIDYRAGVWFAVATIPGAIAGAFMSSVLSGRSFDVAFSSLLFAIAFLLIWRPLGTKAGEEHHKYELRTGIVISVGVGFLSSVLGIGGGIIHVPALIHLLGFPAHIATATSQFILLFSSFTGATTHLSLGHVLIRPAIFMGIGAVAGAQIGAKYGQRVKGPLLVRMFSVALIIVALRLLLR